MTESLVSNFGLVSKIYFPREILPVAAMLARLFFDAAIAGAILLGLIIVYRDQLTINGAAWSVSARRHYHPAGSYPGLGTVYRWAVYVFFRDVRHLVTLGVQIWFYATPIIYPSTAVPDSLQTLYHLNPMAGIIESYRGILLEGSLPSPYLWISAVISFIALAFGYWFFKRVEFQFADVV